MTSSVSPGDGVPPENADEPSQALETIVQDLHVLIQDNWSSIKDNKPCDTTFTTSLRALQSRANQLQSHPLLPRPSESYPGPITSSTYTVSPAIPTIALGPATSYLAAHPGTTNILASAAVFDQQQRILLVQRAPTDFFPLKWELPGGSVDVDGGDGSVVAGAVRELYEETELVARNVKREVMERKFEEGRWRQGVFEVEVEVKEELSVRLDPKEHVAWMWVTEEEVREGRCGSMVLEYADLEWKELLLRAFQRHRVGERLKEFGLDRLW